MSAMTFTKSAQAKCLGANVVWGREGFELHNQPNGLGTSERPFTGSPSGR